MTCQFCEKKGLPIMPLRYAVARADMKFFPALGGEFSPRENIPLPEKEAHYTLRLLRAGYLYVFDEVRGEWTAYVVTREGYLYEFDPNDSNPPSVHDAHFSCDTSGHGHLARCVTVRDPFHAGRIWLGFSDAPWTAATLDKHSTQAYREVHMGVFDMAAWRSGGSQPHVGAMKDTVPQVAEFATPTQYLEEQDNKFFETYFPAPDKFVDGLEESTKKALSPWNYSPQPLTGKQDQTESLQGWIENEDWPFSPVMTAIPDAPGIAMELNGLAIQRALEWTEMPERKQKLQTAASIESLRKAVSNGAVIQSEKKNNTIIQAIEGLSTSFLGNPNKAQWGFNYNTGGYEWQGQHIVFTPEQWRAYAKRNWEKYKECYNEDEVKTFIGNDEGKWGSYQLALQQFDQNVIVPLDKAYVKYLNSPLFKAAFTHNFDAEDIGNGQQYLQAFYACIKDACGRNAARAYLQEQLAKDPTEPANVVIRTFMLNQDELASKWVAAAAAKDPGDPNTPWLNLGVALYQAMMEALKRANVNSNVGLKSLNKYLYQLAGPIAARLGKFIDQGAVWTAKCLPEKRLLGFMQSMLEADGRDLIIGSFVFEGTRGRATYTLAQTLARMSGNPVQLMHPAARHIMMQGDNDRIKGRAMFAMSKDDFERLKTVSRIEGGVRSGTAGAFGDFAHPVNLYNFDEELGKALRRLGNAEVKGGVVGGILAALTIPAAFHELTAAEEAGKGISRARWNVRSAVSSLVGGIAETTGKVAAKTAWGGKSIAVLGKGLRLTYTKALSGAGRLLGGGGGIVAGVLTIMKGYDERQVNTGLGYTLIALGVLGTVAGFLMFFAATAAAGLILGLIVAAAIWVVSLFIENDVEKWLIRAKFFGSKHNFANFDEQHDAFLALVKPQSVSYKRQSAGA